MTYWAISHRYGAQVRDDRGDMIGKIVAFRTKGERDTWVADGPAYSTDYGAREPLVSDCREVRHSIREFEDYAEPAAEVRTAMLLQWFDPANV